MIDQALRWLERGVPLVPLQPGSKHIVPGFGPYQKQITAPDDAHRWFEERWCNLGLVCGRGLVVLDFDLWFDYEHWREQYPGAAHTYTERTSRGYHVFFAGDGASGDVGPIEVKGRGSVVMVAPSRHPLGKTYRAVDERAVILPVPGRFSLLSEKLSSSSAPSLSKESVNRTDLIGRIKAAVPVLELARASTEMRSRDGRWWHGKCPLHDDKTPSFWVDAERGTWGCWTCKVRGDVINLYARLNRLTVRAAIAALAAGL